MNTTRTLAHSPWSALLALDRLNSWVRAKEPWWCPVRSKLRPVVYWTKTKAILEASKVWHIGLRRVMVKKACRVCAGSGIYRSGHWDDDGGEECRKCGATGRVTLKFIESTIGPVRWHTPAEKWHSSSLDVYVPFPSYAYASANETALHYELATDWEPNQPGRQMTYAEIERDILLVLKAWPHEVTFAMDCAHSGCRPRFRRHWGSPDVAAAEEWLRGEISIQASLAA